MEFKFNQKDDFEEFLQNQLRNQRMYPGDAVWKNINRKLHGQKKLTALTISAILISSLSIILCCYFIPKPNIFSANPIHDSKKFTPTASIKASRSVEHSNTKPTGIVANNNKVKGRLTSSSASNSGMTMKAITDNKLGVEQLLAEHQKIVKNKQAAYLTSTGASTLRLSDFDLKQELTKLLSEFHASSNKLVEIAGTEDAKTVTNKGSNDIISPIIKPESHKNRLSYLLYIAPSVSYRNLFEDKSMLRNNVSGPVGINYVTDVNKVVRHKPGTGIEAGINLMYNHSEKLRIKSGLQFNVRQYNIEAYRSNFELASIALVGNNRYDTINTVAVYRNNNGYYSTELTNRYYQLSVPIGIEWEIMGNKRIQLNVAGSIQPTYLLNRNAYLISTNFKNYTENPDMVRAWNINSNIETFISVKIGDYKWQLGPQIRYQPYSTFISEYPIKEHLMDYGIKFGVSKFIK